MADEFKSHATHGIQPSPHHEGYAKPKKDVGITDKMLDNIQQHGIESMKKKKNVEYPSTKEDRAHEKSMMAMNPKPRQ